MTRLILVAGAVELFAITAPAAITKFEVRSRDLGYAPVT